MGIRWTFVRAICGALPAFGLMLTAAAFASQDQTASDIVDNPAIVEMTKARIGDSIIIKLIRSGPTALDTSPSALVGLKTAGVSDAVIEAMVSAGPAATSAPSRENLYDTPDEIGVYVNIREQLVPLHVEVVTMREGGVVKRLLLPTRGHVNAVVNTRLSVVRLDSRPEFIISAPGGTAAAEYQLLRFWEKSDRREFRLTTGGVFHASSGANRNLVAVDVAKVAARLYRVRSQLPLPKGEYGFLPPGAALSASAASLGKIYTFGVDPQR